MVRADEAPIGRLQAPRKDRNPRESRNSSGPRRDSSPTEGMIRYRVSVGHKDGVKPGQLVGALANEGGIEGARIGRIDIRNAFSVVELPKGLPASILSKMSRAKVSGRPLEISEDSAPERAPRRRSDGDAPVRRERA
jgi:ATP-dependent RNA helicase DeaD